MHAKLTRDRKKSFMAVLEKTVSDLQAEVLRLKDLATPDLGPVPAPRGSPPPFALESATKNPLTHGFSLAVG